MASSLGRERERQTERERTRVREIEGDEQKAVRQRERLEITANGETEQIGSGRRTTEKWDCGVLQQITYCRE